ncbi:MAG: hypothetical protein QE271_02435 [Bacteriovoracaceae bacterium]|nr:hypothetical protein [Bacteriovoracaceae bacterium]
MKKLAIALIALSSFSVFAKGQCYLNVLQNGTTTQTFSRTKTTLKACMLKAAQVLKANASLENPTVIIHHPDLPTYDTYLRTSDGMVADPKL